MRDVISTCPVCEHELSVTRLHCRECGTTLEGEFSVGRFSRLSRDQMRVLESFLRSRGNLREMERDLGLSYPTVRSRVDGLVRALGFVPFDGGRAADDDAAADKDSPIAGERRRILESLARHEIDAETAAAALRHLSSGTPSPAVVEPAASAAAASAQSAESAQPAEPAHPVEPAQPAEPADPARSTEPAASDQTADITPGDSPSIEEA